jgi:glucoamylase
VKPLRAAIGVVALLTIGATLASGGLLADSVQQRYLTESNALRTVERSGTARTVTVHSLGEPDAVSADPGWLAAARPLGGAAPAWARRMYRRSLLVLHALTDERSGAVEAGAREGWRYVWPRDASTVASALAAAGYRGEARRIVGFLRGLDLGAAARFQNDGAPVEGRAAQGDAAGWIATAAKAAGLPNAPAKLKWRGLDDYQENGSGDFLGNAIASGSPDVRALFETPSGELSRRAGDPSSGLDSAAAWAVRPFPRPALYPAVRRTLLQLAASSGRFGILPSEDWDGGIDPWTAPTAWTAWSLAAVGERPAALQLMAELRRAATPTAMLPERVDAHTGIPTSTTPLAWSHAFAILALRQLWPTQAGQRQRPSQ